MSLAAAPASSVGRLSASWPRILITPIIIGLFAVLIVQDLQREQDLRHEIFRSYDARDSLQGMFDLVQDAESAQRGYLLTGDRQLLDAYMGAAALLPSKLKTVELALAGGPEQAGRLRSLHDLIDAERSALQAPLTAPRPTTGAAFTGMDDARRLMSRIRAVTGDLEAGEARRLAGLRTAREDVRTRINWVAGVTLTGLFLALLAAQWIDWRRNRRHTQLADELGENATRMNAIFGTAMDGIITLTPDGLIESANPAAERMFGYPVGSLVRQNFAILVDVTAQRAEAFVRRMQSRDPELDNGITRELTARHVDGSAIPVEVAVRTMSLPGGLRLVAVVRDISERRRAERLKEEFVSTVSHELRTPLTSIAGALGLLKAGAGGVLPDRAGRLVQIAESNSTRLVRLINNILDMEKFEGGHATLGRTPQSLNEVTSRAVEMMAGLAEKRRIHLTVATSPLSPIVSGDADRLLQVLTNLLSNAINFSPAQGVVQVQVRICGERAHTTVVDRGAGVPESFRPRLFQKFAQADGTDTRDHAGTGLGLAIAKEIAELHDGDLVFSPTEGGGASFTLDLPLHASTKSVEAPGRPRLLVCEDDALTVEMLRMELERFGYEVDTAGSANEARLALHTAQYAALLLDLGLPDANGLTLVQALRSAPATRDLPVIVISGSSDANDDGHRLDLVDWLYKPVNFVRLRKAIETALSREASRPPLILHVDDDIDLLEVTRGVLGGAGEIVTAHNLASARAALRDRRPDVVVLDLGLPDGSGADLIDEMLAADGGPIPTIVYTAMDAGDALDDRVSAVFTKSRVGLQHLAEAVKAVTQIEASAGSHR